MGGYDLSADGSGALAVALTRERRRAHRRATGRTRDPGPARNSHQVTAADADLLELPLASQARSVFAALNAARVLDPTLLDVSIRASEGANR